jgi:hypothetical protein
MITLEGTFEGQVSCVWPEDQLTAEVSRELFLELVKTHNRAVRYRLALEIIAEPPGEGSYHHGLLRRIEKAKEALK